MWKRVYRIGLGRAGVWVFLAHIAPAIFQVRPEVLSTMPFEWVFRWLLNPVVGWALVPLIIFGFLWYLDRLEKEVDVKLLAVYEEARGVAARYSHRAQIVKLHTAILRLAKHVRNPKTGEPIDQSTLGFGEDEDWTPPSLSGRPGV